MEYDECPALQSWHTNHAPWGRGVWGKGLGRGLEKGLGSLKKRVSVVILNKSAERDRAQHPIALQSCGLQIAQIHLGIKAGRHCVTG